MPPGVDCGGPAPLKHRALGHRIGQVLPDVLGHVAQHRGDQPGQALDHQVQHRLAAAPPEVTGAAHIEAVFGDVEVDVGEVNDAEVLQRLEEAVELVALKVACDVVDQGGGALQHPLIQQRQLLIGHGVALGHEVVQVAQQIAGRVAHLAVDVGQLLDDARAQGHIGRVVDRAHPQPQHVGPKSGLLLFVLAALDQHRRIDDVAERFAHLAALLIEGEAVGQHPPVGGLAIDGHRGQQAALKPAPVLVTALEVEIGRVVERGRVGVTGQLAEATQDTGPRRARVKPHIHGVGALAPVGRLGHPRFGQQAGLVALPPDIRAVLGDQRPNVLQGLLVEQHLARFAVIEDRDRHAPGALAADAPVAPLTHHAFDAVPATGRQPFDLGDGLQGRLAKALDRGEPLFGRPEDRRFLGAPVVGVAVAVGGLGQQGAGLLQGRDDRPVGVLEHIEAGKGTGFGRQRAGFVDRAQHLEVVLAAGVEVVDAVAGRRVHQAGAALGGDVIAAEHHRAAALEQGVAVDDALELGALDLQHRGQLQTQARGKALAQLGSDHQMAARPCGADGVVQGAVDRDRQVGRQGPGGGGPDRHRQLLAGDQPGCIHTGGLQLLGQCLGQRFDRKGRIDAGRDVSIGVLELSLGQGGAGAGAPVHRFEASVDVPGQHHLAKHPDLGGLIGLVQGQVGLLPVGPDAPAFKAALLQRHLLKGIGVGLAPQLERCQGGAFVGLEPLQHLELDRQAVAVPARHKPGPFALQQGGLVDDVLEDLVEGVAHMQGPIGIGRAVVQGEHRARIVLAEPLVEPQFGPKRLQLGFAHLGVGAHAETGLQQVERVLVARGHRA